MKSLLNQIESTKKLDGWCTLLKAQRLAALVVALQPEVSVELGIFGGRSFLPIALAHKFIGKGTAIGVEPWSNQMASEGYPKEHADWWNGIDFERIKNTFLSQVNLMGVQNCVQIVQMSSDDFTPPENIGLLHIDGQHTEQALKDVRRFCPNVKKGGVLILDDLGWTNNGTAHVTQAIDWVNRNGFRELYRIVNKPSGLDDWGVWIKL